MGNIIRLPGRELFVTEACSGLRSLTALVGLGVLIGAFALRHPISRLAILARMVTKAPEKKLGRTQVMKLFYFLQELKDVPLGYDFRLFTYGPFDSDVLSDLATACSLNMLLEKTIIYSRGYGYEITPGPHANQLTRELEASNPILASQIDDVVREFGSYGAAELELRSTILFVEREFASNLDPARRS